MYRAAIPLVLLLTAAATHAALQVRVYFPFDGDVAPQVTPVQVEPQISGGQPAFGEGLRGQGLIVGGAGGAFIQFRDPSLVNATQGSAAFLVRSLGWDSTERIGTYFFRLLDNAFLYKYLGFEDEMSFYCKHNKYNRYLLHDGRLQLRDGQWRHVVVTWLDEVVRMYVNGRRVSAHFLWEPMNQAEHGQGIAFANPGGEQRICLDEFYLLDYALSDAEIASVSQAGLAGQEPQIAQTADARTDVVYYPGLRKVRVWVQCRADAAIATLTLLGPDGHEWPLGEAPFADGIARATCGVPEEVPAATLIVRAAITDANGARVAEATSAPFQRRIYPWMAEAAGIGVSNEVIPPFTPLRVEGRSVYCWGRRYDLADDGWPAQIMSREADLLTGPVQLRARVDGAQARPLAGVAPAFRRTEPGVVEFTTLGARDPLGATLRGRIEYDGMIRYTLRLDPQRPVTVNELRLDIPIADAHASLYHVCRDAIRTSNEAGFTPAGSGKVWGSSARPSRYVLGTFAPYWWVGDYDRGLCWMCDSDEGWSVPDDEDCIELWREGDTLTARVNFIRREKVISEPWEVTFALMAGPPRPEPSGWRMGRVPGNPEGMSDFKVAWFYGPLGSQGYGRPPDLDAWRQFAREKIGATPSVDWGLNVGPNDFWLVPEAEENHEFQLEWRFGCPLEVRNDYVAYWVDKLMGEGLVTGLYADDTYPRSCPNLMTGCGYVREDGMVQAGYNMFGNRDFFKRLAFIHHQHGGRLDLMVHMTDAMIMPSFCFWDDKHDNEWSKRTGDAEKDHIDEWPLEEIAARSMSRQWGMAATWHTPAGGHGDDLGTLCLLHDIIGRVESMQNRTLPAKLLFGFGEDDVEFAGYWMLGAEPTPRSDDIKVSAWLRRDEHTALLVVANLSRQAWRGTLRLPLSEMGLEPDAVACDAEDERPSLPLQGGKLALAVEPHNYRLVMLGPPGRFPADLPRPGADLPPPAQLIADLCDDFDRPEPGPRWELVTSDVAAGEIETYRGRLSVLGPDYRFAAAQMPLGRDEVTARVRIERTGRYHQNRVGLALVWPNGNAVFAGTQLKDGTFHFASLVGGKPGRRQFVVGADLSRPGDMHQMSWVRIDLTPEAVRFFGSGGGKQWLGDWELPRGADFAGAPAFLRLGKNPDGIEDPHLPGPTYAYFDDLIVGTM